MLSASMYSLYCKPLTKLSFSLNVVLLANLFLVGSCKISGKIQNVNELVSSDFKTLVLSGLFVDKSLLIDEILTRDEKVFQITRPVKWGKTLNLDMLRCFFEIEADENGKVIREEKKKNPAFFQGGTVGGGKRVQPLNISNSHDAMKYLGKHPVISLSLKDIKGNMEEIDKRMKNKIVNLFLSYPFLGEYLKNESSLLDDDEKLRLNNFISGTLKGEYLLDCLDFLSMLLFEHYESYVCLFIDDYDIPLINAYLEFGDRGGEFENIVEMLKKFYDYTFKENQYILKAVITGTLNFDIVPSGISEFEYRYILYDTVLDKPFSRFYGFSGEETTDLFSKLNVTIDPIEVHKWYGGSRSNETEVFNPFCVMKHITTNGKFNYFLQDLGETDLANFLDRAFSLERNQENMVLLTEGSPILRESFQRSIPLNHVAGDVYSVCFHSGYLNVIPPQRALDKPIWRMKSPNLETRGRFASGLRIWTAKDLNISNSEYDSFTNLLNTHETKTFGERLHQVLSRLDRFNASAPEQSYHRCMSGIAASLGIGSIVDTIRELGENRGEMLIIPIKDYGYVAINIEYNICKPWQKIETIVHASLESLVHKPKVCTNKIRIHQHVTKILYVAIAFCGQQVVLKDRTVDIR